MAFSSKTGSFTKNAGTGNQAITGVGFTPKALILWAAYETTTDSITTSYSTSLGMTTGASEMHSVSFSSQGGVATSNNSRRAAAKALTVVQYGETLLAEADLVSFDGDGFTLNWTTNTGGTQIIHYLALGGSDLSGQKVLSWTSPTSTGAKAVTGVGFKPDQLIFLRWAPDSNSALPVSSAAQTFGLSIVDKSGNSVALNVGGADGVTPSPGVDYDTYRVIKTDKAIFSANAAGATLDQATLTSMDADGFTLNYTTANVADVVGCLALKGLRAKVGSFTSASAITGVGFLPSTALFLGTQRANTNFAFALQLDLGATTGASDNQSTAVVDSRIVGSSPGNTDASGVDSTGKCITRLFTGPVGILTQAALSSFDSDGFTLSWSSGTVSDIIGYLALGAAPTIATVAASNVTTTGAQLNGTVNPKGSNATYYFEWGLTTSYGNTTAVQGPTAGSTDLAFNASISGLTGNTGYHFRAVTEATGTIIYGSDQSFTTPGVDRAVMVF